MKKLKLNPGFPDETVSGSYDIFFFNTAFVTPLVIDKSWDQWLCFRDETHTCYVQKHKNAYGLISVGLIT